SSLNKIAKGLEADGILTGAGRKKWYSSSLHKILTNEKYMGDALLQKTYTVDYLSKKRVNKEGVVRQYYVENNHEAIIPKHLFMLVQEEVKNEKLLILVKMAKGEITAASTVWLRLYFVKTVGRYLEESIGITEGRGQSFGDAS